jgi:6-phosphogluconate dehydrogenase (decarboxylating)
MSLDHGISVRQRRDQRFISRGEADDQDKAISALRYGFGGHLEKVAGK